MCFWPINNSVMARGVGFLLGFRQYPFLKKNWPGIPVFGYCPYKIIISSTEKRFLVFAQRWRSFLGGRFLENGEGAILILRSSLTLVYFRKTLGPDISQNIWRENLPVVEESSAQNDRFPVRNERASRVQRVCVTLIAGYVLFFRRYLIVDANM